MKSLKIAGISSNIIAWALVLTSTIFSWLFYAGLKNGEAVFPAAINQLRTAETVMLVISIIVSVALLALTISISSYTLRFKEMNSTAATLFFLEWILIAIAVVSLWLVPRSITMTDSNGNRITAVDNYQLAAAITGTVAFALFTLYYIIEIIPYIDKNDSNKKSKTKKKQSSRS